MRGFLFDLDGTLIDSDADLAAAANAARAALDRPPLPVAEVAGWIGRGAGYLLRGVLPGASEADLARARQAFITHYRAHLLDQTRPCPGAEEALARCGGRAGLVTNKPGAFVDEILAALAWRRHFAVVVAGDTLPQRKPDPAPLRHALAHVDAAAYVGDSEVDQQAAHAAGLPFIAVAWGRVDHPVRVATLDEIFAAPCSR